MYLFPDRQFPHRSRTYAYPGVQRLSYCSYKLSWPTTDPPEIHATEVRDFVNKIIKLGTGKRGGGPLDFKRPNPERPHTTSVAFEQSKFQSFPIYREGVCEETGLSKL